MNRRKFLMLTGGGIVLAAGTGLGAIAFRSPDQALRPWLDAGSLYSEPRKKALSYAILAPNPHNQQPWLVDLSEENRVILSVDQNRLLPQTDPFARQITIGFGCFIEVLRMAAAADGYTVTFDLFPEGEDVERLDQRPVAVATFRENPDETPDPLFQHVLDRRSLKVPYDLDKPVSDNSLSAISEAAIHTQVSATNEKARVGNLRALTRKALEIEIETPRTYKESVDLFRIGKDEIEANPDGIDFSGPMFELLNATGQFSREAALDLDSTAFAQGKASVLANVDTAMAHIWQVTTDNSRADQIRAGRDWVRLNLAATANGIGTQPLSQALQEYPEMDALYRQVHSELAPDGGTVQMLARLGYAAPPPPSPRWPVSAKIIKE